jgi:hypothetical protein
MDGTVIFLGDDYGAAVLYTGIYHEKQCWQLPFSDYLSKICPVTTLVNGPGKA